MRIPFDPDRKLSSAARKRMEKLRDLPDEKLDFSEIPPLGEDFWKGAVRNPYMKAWKEQVTLRIDAPVLAWLKRDGPGYQTRLNQVLRDAMLKDVARSIPGPYKAAQRRAANTTAAKRKAS